MTLETHIIPGELPEGWNRSVVFFANIRSLFFGNESGARILSEEVGALESYGGRLIPLIDLIFRGGANVLVLERAPAGELLQYFENDLGLTLPEIKVIPHHSYCSIIDDEEKHSPLVRDLIRELRAHRSEWLDGYVTDPVLGRLADLRCFGTAPARAS